MSELHGQAKNILGRTERRLHPRRNVMSMAPIELGQDNGGSLLNLSEGGLALQSAMVLWWGELHDARFQLPGSGTWINARTRVLHLSKSKKEAGLEFVQISEESKAQIREWVAAGTVQAQAGEPIRGEVDWQPAPSPITKEMKEEKVQQVEPTRWADPVATPLAESRTWETLAPGPLASNWVDRDGFGADPTESAPRNTGWLRFTLVAIALAVTFFFVGSNIAQTPLQHWFVLAMRQFNWSKPNVAEAPTATSVTPPTNTPAPLATAPSESDNSEPKLQAGDQKTQQPAETPSAGEDKPARPDTPPAGEVAKPPSAERPSEDRAAGARRPAGGLHLREEFPAETASPASRQTSAVPAAGIDKGLSGLTEQVILVTAPAAGHPAFYVDLPEEAISASSRIAMSAHRSLRVSPRSARPQAERVRVGQIVSRSEPYYPVEALKQKLGGDVQLHAIVGRAGEITNVRVVSGPPLLAAAATAAVRDWRYEPTLIDGNPVETELDILVTFRLP